MHQALIKAKAEAADRARKAALEEARKEADRRRIDSAVGHLIEALEDAFGGLLACRYDNDTSGVVGRLYATVSSPRHPPMVGLRVWTDPDPAKHTGACSGICPRIGSDGAVYYEHYCSRDSGSQGKSHGLVDLLDCVAKEVVKKLVDDPDPPAKVPLTTAERAKLAALLRADGATGEDRMLADRLDPPTEHPGAGGRPGRAIEVDDPATPAQVTAPAGAKAKPRARKVPA